MADLVTFSVSTVGETMAKSFTDARGFQIYMDEPADLGGDDKAPSPLDFILAAHGGCLNYMCHFIAKELDMKLDRVEVSINASLDPAKFAGQNTSARAGYQSFDVDIKVTTSASAERIAELKAQVEQRCPVSDNITNATPVSISMTPA